MSQDPTIIRVMRTTNKNWRAYTVYAGEQQVFPLAAGKATLRELDEAVTATILSRPAFLRGASAFVAIFDDSAHPELFEWLERTTRIPDSVLRSSETRFSFATRPTPVSNQEDLVKQSEDLLTQDLRELKALHSVDPSPGVIAQMSKTVDKLLGAQRLHNLHPAFKSTVNAIRFQIGKKDEGGWQGFVAEPADGDLLRINYDWATGDTPEEVHGKITERMKDLQILPFQYSIRLEDATDPTAGVITQL